MLSGTGKQQANLANARGGRALSFFGSYMPPLERFDELCGVPQTEPLSPEPINDAWQRLDTALGNVGATEFSRLWDQTRHALRENGIAYGSVPQAEGSLPTEDRSRPWQFDPIPMVIPAAEWESIAAALEQRARLLGEILTDLLGPQRLLTSGLLPGEVLFRHPLFHRALWTERSRAPTPLVLYAADIARDHTGKWWVLGDRTEAPSGLGFALENRLLTSRMLPGAFHRLNVRRLASFFIDLRESTARLAPRQSDRNANRTSDPRVVLLTRGESSARYFEDTFLARYLGYTLAEGQDLVVRGDQLYFKTLGGLLPVDVVLRRPDSRTLDPLEIVASQCNGTSGFFQAWRLGQVGMVNPPGSGIVEAPVMMAFLPFLCQEMLGEPLRMPAVATWWLGAEVIRKKILRRLDDVVIRPAFERPGPRAEADTARMARMSKEKLTELICSRPHDFVAQEKVQRSSVPVWCGGSGVSQDATSERSAKQSTGNFQSGSIVVRAFQVQRGNPGEYQTLQGGLVRVEPLGREDWPCASHVKEELGKLETSPGTVELCKDLWVLADEPVRYVTLLDQHQDVVAVRRGGAELPSRVADNLFWVGRHLERTEAVARLLRSVALRLTGEELSNQLPEMSMLLRAMVEQNQIEPDYAVPDILGSLRPLEQVLPQLVCDPMHHGGLRYRTDTLIRTASTVRDRISGDSWRAIRKVGEVFDGVEASRASLADVLELANETILALTAFSGLASESMTRTTTWRFLDLGRRLERATQSASILHCASEVKESVATTSTFVALLENAESLITYRSRYQSGFRWGPVCDLLICDTTNPRSIAYQLLAIEDHVRQLPKELHRPADEELIEAAALLVRLVEKLDPSTLIGPHSVSAIAKLVIELEVLLPRFSDTINHLYFVHTPTQRMLGGLDQGDVSTGGDGFRRNIAPEIDSEVDPQDWGGGAI